MTNKTTINANCLKHPSVIAKIDKAMRDSVQMSAKTVSKLGWSLVKNSKGETLMHVRYARVGQRTELKFFDKHLQDITNVVRKLLKESAK